MSTKHSILAPSSAYQWVHCSGAPELQKLFPNVDTAESLEGDAAHWVAYTILKRICDSSELIGKTAPNDVTVTYDMVKYVRMYADFIREICYPLGLMSKYRVEEKLSINRVHPDCFGTVDCYVFDASKKTIHIFDLKYGWVLVDAYENWQCICYALGVLQHLKEHDDPQINSLQDTEIFVHIHIVQPRAPHPEGPIRTWRVRASDLRGYANRLEYAAHEALSGTTKTVSGPHCKYCPARTVCHAAHKSAMLAVDMIGTSIPHELDLESLSATIQTLRRAQDMVTCLLDAHEERAAVLLKRGAKLPHYGLGSSGGKRYWVKDKDALVELAQLYNVNILKEPDILTPAQAIAAGVPKDVVEVASQYKPYKLKLIEIDNIAKKVFSNDNK